VEKVLGGSLLNMLCLDQNTTDAVVKIIERKQLLRITIVTLNQLAHYTSNIKGNENECSLLKNFIETKEDYINT